MTALLHAINSTGEKSKCDTPGHSDAVVTCSCGWNTRFSHEYTSSSVVLKAILYHRISVLEGLMGVKVVMTYGPQE